MKIAFFDFDGTITDKDTLLEVIKFQKGDNSFWAGFLLNMPFLIGLKLKLISNQAAKERILKYFFRGMTEAEFEEGCDMFAARALPNMIRKGALAEIDKLKSQYFEIVIVSASAENWIQGWSDSIGVKLIGSQLEVIKNKLTGNIKGLNCNGEEKVNRIKALYDLSKYDEIYCYGDSNGDTAMLALGTKSFYKPFRQQPN